MATVQKQIRQFNAMTRYRVRNLVVATKNPDAVKIQESYLARKEVERASLVKSVSTMNIDRLMKHGLRV